MASANTEGIRLKLTGITKHFPGVTANAGISLDVRRGEILAILGENGAGKSTLMSIVSGMLDPDEGSIEVDGRPARIRKPADARQLGIGMVYQHFALAPTLTVAENLALSSIGSRGIFANIGGVSARVREMSEAYHLDIDPDALVDDLSVGARQRVEIIKLLFGGAEILILDEPTSVLTPLEWEHLVGVIRNLAGKGHSIILITHKLDELMGIADRCTVLRQGRVVGTVDVADTDKAELARMTIGRDVMFDVRIAGRELGSDALIAEDIRLVDRDGRLALDGVSLRVRAGEILGIAGVDGNGQQELAEVLTGLRTPTSGRLRYSDDRFTVMSPLDFYRLGGSVIPADRHHTGLAVELSVRDNLVMKELALGRLQRWGIINDAAVDEFCSDLIGEYDIRTPDSRAKIRHLSGGNQQKVVLARELCRRPPLLIAAQPTRGLDVGATETVLSRLQAERQRGCAIVLFSTEIEEILLLSDRVAVMVDGKFLATLDRHEATYARLGLLMGGEAIEEEDEATMLEAVGALSSSAAIHRFITSGRVRDPAVNVLLAIVLVIVGVAISLGIIAATGGSPVDALRALLDGSLGTRERMAITAARMSPLILIALGWIVAFRGAKVNLGLQGQMIAGGIAAAYIALEGPSLPPALALIVATLAGVTAGALYAAIAAVLWANRGVNEIVSTLMLTFIAQQVLLWIVRGPLHDLSSSAFQSRPLPSEYRWPVLVDRTPFTAEVFLTIAAVAIIVFVLKRTVFGYKLRLAGENPESARHAGVRTVRTIVLSFVVSGGLAGLSGTALVIGGERNVLSGGFAGNIGFTGIVVALVARNSPVGCVAAAALFAILDTGGSVMQVRADVPSEMILITQGIIVVLVATSVILTRRLEARAASRRATREHEDAAVR